MTYEPPPEAPIVCTIRPGDEQAALDAYRSLFFDALLDGERTSWGVRWTFRDVAGIEDRVRTLAAIEQDCCAFLRMAITVADGQVVWEVIGPPNAAEFLDKYAQLPRTVRGDTDSLRAGVRAAGLTINDQR